jgi:hypothetical protein
MTHFVSTLSSPQGQGGLSSTGLSSTGVTPTRRSTAQQGAPCGCDQPTTTSLICITGAMSV